MIDRPKANDIPPIMSGIFMLPPYDDQLLTLLGAFCPVCRAYYFPRPRYCRTCLGALQDAGVGTEGIIYSFTIVRKKAPFGLPMPYGAGIVDLKESGLRIYSLLDPAALDKLRIGLPVRLVVNALGHDGKGAPCLRPYFTPMSAQNHPGENSPGKMEI